MNISYETYRIFYYVATCGSISAAAKKLLISQPAVTFQIQSLETQLGLTLFIRTKKGVTLTDEGKVFYEYIKKGIESFTNGENALTNMKNLDYGIIRIGASTTVSKHILMPYLEKFHEEYPNIDIRIVNTLTEDLLKELRNGNLDMLVLNLPTKEAKDLNIIKIKEVHDTFVGNKKYFEKTKGKLTIENLNKYPLLFQKSPSNTRTFLDNYLKKNKQEITPKMEIVSYNLIMDFVASGFGIGYATKEFIQKELEENKLYEIPITPPIPERHIGIVTLNNTIPNYSVKKLIDKMTNNK